MKIMVIDGNTTIINRAFYGVHMLNNHEGLPTNAIYGFLSTLFRLQDEQTPDRIIVCFDVKAKTFRHEKFDTYKATERVCQMNWEANACTERSFDAMGLIRCELAGFEADHLIGTISRQAEERGDTVYRYR